MSGRGRKANISYVKPPEPAFLKRIKEKVGYKEGPTVDTKKQTLDIDEDGEDEKKAEKDDEKPVVVVLQAGDLSQEEAERIVDKLRAEETETVEKDPKITFKKPGKRSSSTEETNTCSTSKKAKQTALVVGAKRAIPVGTDGADSKQVNNRSLLSFDDEEDDD